MPLRIKLTLAFTGVMAVLLTGAGIALTLLVAQNLDSTIDDGLIARAGDASAVVDSGRLASTGEPYAQVLGASRNVIETTTGAGPNPLLGPAEFAEASRGDVIVETRRQGVDLRLLARPVQSQQGPAVL